MRFKFLMGFVLLISTVVNASPKISDADNKKLDQLIDSSTRYECDAIKSKEVSAVLNGFFVKAKIIKVKDDSYSERILVKTANGDFAVMKNEGKLKNYIQKSFRIKSKNDAKKFEKALDKIFPVFNLNKKILKKNGQWLFVRGRSFGKKTGVIVDVDGNGKIVSIKNSDDIEKNIKVKEVK